MRGDARSMFFNRKNDATPKDWFRIENKANGPAEIFIYDEIGYWGTTAQGFVDQLKDIGASDIHLHINSPGGEVFDGVAIYTALVNHSAHVTVFVDALAASAASFIAMAGDNIVMSRGSTMMIHDGLAFCVGNEKDMMDTASVLSKISNNIADIYASRAGGSVEEWRALMREEVWYTAQEAVDAGLADEVSKAGSSSDSGDEVSNKWDLSIFAHKGRGDAPSPEDVKKKIISNRAKEAPVATKNTNGVSAATPVAVSDTVEGSDTVETAAGAVVEEVVTPEALQPEPVAGPVNRAEGFAFMVGGKMVADHSAIQAHINSLEGFQRDTRDQNRKDFCKSLSDGNKILATQLDSVEEFALGLSSDQYEAWKATYDLAPGLSMLSSHAAGVSNSNGDGSQAGAAEADRIRDLKDIITQHRMSGMSPEKIMNTGSFKELSLLDPTFKL